MKTVYARQGLPKSIFLAGPTPRNMEARSWRPEALRLLEKFNFDGTVFVPEDEGFDKCFNEMSNYDAQVFWEWEGIMTATCVLFWIPRDLVTMPALTTNVEFGMVEGKRVVSIGWPEDAPKNRYLGALAQRYGDRISHTLEDTVIHAIRAASMPFNL